jgi:hypothetical protein
LPVIVDDTDDEAVVKEKKEKALAEHVARHPEDVGRTVEDFNWIMRIIVRSWQGPPALGSGNLQARSPSCRQPAAATSSRRRPRVPGPTAPSWPRQSAGLSLGTYWW